MLFFTHIIGLANQNILWPSAPNSIVCLAAKRERRNRVAVEVDKSSFKKMPPNGVLSFYLENLELIDMSTKQNLLPIIPEQHVKLTKEKEGKYLFEMRESLHPLLPKHLKGKVELYMRLTDGDATTTDETSREFDFYWRVGGSLFSFVLKAAYGEGWQELGDAAEFYQKWSKMHMGLLSWIFGFGSGWQ